MKEIILQIILKLVGGFIVGIGLMQWLGKPVDIAQVIVFAIGLTALLFQIPKLK